MFRNLNWTTNAANKKYVVLKLELRKRCFGFKVCDFRNWIIQVLNFAYYVYTQT